MTERYLEEPDETPRQANARMRPLSADVPGGVPDPSLSQADLEEALKARVTDLTDERDGLIDALIRAEEDRDEALAASRQPVSGGPEGDVEALREALAWLTACAYEPGSTYAVSGHARVLLAALSRVPADGEQPADESVVEVRVDSFCEWLASEVGLTDPQMESVRESLAMVASPPADGEDQRLTPEQWEAVAHAVAHVVNRNYERDWTTARAARLSLLSEALPVLRALAGSVGEPDGGEGAEDG